MASWPTSPAGSRAMPGSLSTSPHLRSPPGRPGRRALRQTAARGVRRCFSSEKAPESPAKARAISPINQDFRILGEILATAWHKPDSIYHHLSALGAGPVHRRTRATPGPGACLRGQTDLSAGPEELLLG